MQSLTNNRPTYLRQRVFRPAFAGMGPRIAMGSRPALVRAIAGLPAGNHMPKPPVEVWPLFGIVALPLSFACWIMYQKMVNDVGVIVTTPRWQSGFHEEEAAKEAASGASTH